MIKVNGEVVNYGRFPDGTVNVKGDSTLIDGQVVITWHYESDAEYMPLVFLTKFYQAYGNKVILFLPYVPNARMDRVEEAGDVFTMKYFGEMINDLHFEKVFIMDVHSSVALAAIKNCWIEPIRPLINSVIDIVRDNTYGREIPLIFFPDEGSMKRYGKNLRIPYAYGMKKRDWKTGKILGLDVCGINPEDVKGRTVLIIDDICSYGGTFYYSAKKLKEMGAKNVVLYVTHCENSIMNGQFGEKKENLFDTGLIEQVFTTNSICKVKHDKLVVIKLALNVCDDEECDCESECGCCQCDSKEDCDNA